LRRGWALEEALGRRPSAHLAIVIGAGEGGVAKRVGLSWNNVMDESLLPFSLLESLG
jgi:hypothetical protein